MKDSKLSRALRAGPEEIYWELEESPRQRRRLQAALHAARDRERTVVAREAALRDIVLAYRKGPQRIWAPILLEAIAPALLESLRRHHPVGPALDRDDLGQQLLQEALEVALSIALPRDPRYLQKRLVEAASKRLFRRRRREARLQSQLEYQEVDREPQLGVFTESQLRVFPRSQLRVFPRAQLRVFTD